MKHYIMPADLSSAKMLCILNDEERRSVLETAAIVQSVLAGMDPSDRPSFSNTDMGNLAYCLRVNSFKAIPMRYSECFTRALYQYLVQTGNNTVSEPLMDDIMAVAELYTAAELSSIHQAIEAERCNEPLFDFSVLSTGTTEIEVSKPAA